MCPESVNPTPPTGAALRRALRRVTEGRVLDPVEAQVLVHARGEDLARLLAAAATVRDAGLVSAGRPRTMTYSRKVFVDVTRLCRNHCHYCTFTRTPAGLERSGQAPFLDVDQVLALARAGAAAGCKEALFTLGDRPEDRWPAAAAWLERAGFASTVDYLAELAVRVTAATGLLVHINAGVLSWQEINRLKPLTASLGLMLESSARRLFTQVGGPHYGSPDKDPVVRLRTIEDAGRLSVPFTSGILVGIGETPAERVAALFALRRLDQEYGHLQEVIVQNFRAKPGAVPRAAAELGLEEYQAVLAVARLVLGPRARVQAPPNLSAPEDLPSLLAAGVDDWGGISPVTADHVNPERPWPQLDVLATRCAQAGFTLVERLAVHPEYLALGEPWLDPRLAASVRALADPVTGLAADRPVGSSGPKREPGPDWVAAGDPEASAVAGSQDLAADEGPPPSRPLTPGRRAPERLGAEISAALAAAERDPARLSDDQAGQLAQAEGPALTVLTRIADELRRRAVGDSVTYVVNRNLNFTNVCYTGCGFCAFARRRQDVDAFTLSLTEIGDRAAQAQEAGATEVCLQGGIDPQLPGTAYVDIARTVSARAPGLHVHAFSPMEAMNGAARTRLPLREWLIRAKEAGLDSMPGTAAEILVDDVRRVLTKGKLPTAAWVEVIETAHAVGLPTTATMMYGHVDTPAHWVAHLRVLAGVQRRSLERGTVGLTEFVALPFIHQHAPLYLAGLARPGPTERENLLVHALARILLFGLVDNIQTSWVKLGVAGAQRMLQAGANDLGGTLTEERISRTAGARHGMSLTPADLVQAAAGIGRPSRQRTTTYGVVAVGPGAR